MQALVAYWFARTRRISGLNTRRVVLASFVIALVLSRFFVALWRNSGDEYGYFYLAKTLSLGRLWNPPAPDADLFETYWIFEKLGKRLSQYPPGWSVFLVPFVKLG
ncbi:MAG: hypothetical protein ACJ8AW_20255, partial [Rhodopila sp.]